MAMKPRDLEVVVDGRHVAGACWAPDTLPSASPLVVFGHGLTHDCRSPFHVPIAAILAEEFGIASLALDAPGHGSRMPRSDAGREEIWLAYREQWRADGGAGIAAEISAAIAQVGAVLGATPGPIAYWGLSLGTQYGLAFLAREQRVRAAVLGLFGVGPVVRGYAERVQCPVLFLLQEADELHPTDSVEELFRCLASRDKRLIASPGPHEGVPPAVVRTAIAFIARRLIDGD
jgi:pimeloyl-ACP methyl ester carboxylesterase